jgi:hypothetical protein
MIPQKLYASDRLGEHHASGEISLPILSSCVDDFNAKMRFSFLKMTKMTGSKKKGSKNYKLFSKCFSVAK